MLLFSLPLPRSPWASGAGAKKKLLSSGKQPGARTPSPGGGRGQQVPLGIRVGVRRPPSPLAGCSGFVFCQGWTLPSQGWSLGKGKREVHPVSQRAFASPVLSRRRCSMEQHPPLVYNAGGHCLAVHWHLGLTSLLGAQKAAPWAGKVLCYRKRPLGSW